MSFFLESLFKQLQDNQDVHYDKNYKKPFNRDRIIYPWSISMPAINIIYINADQFTTMKKSELLEFVERKKPQIIVICEVKPKIPREPTELDYVMPGYSVHPVNLDSNIGRGILIYIHYSIDNCVIQSILTSSLVKHAHSKYAYFYRSPTTTSTSGKNNANLNNLLKYLSGKKYSQQCFVGDFNFRNINCREYVRTFVLLM